MYAIEITYTKTPSWTQIEPFDTWTELIGWLNNKKTLIDTGELKSLAIIKDKKKEVK